MKFSKFRPTSEVRNFLPRWSLIKIKHTRSIYSSRNVVFGGFWRRYTKLTTSNPLLKFEKISKNSKFSSAPPYYWLTDDNYLVRLQDNRVLETFAVITVNVDTTQAFKKDNCRNSHQCHHSGHRRRRYHRVDLGPMFFSLSENLFTQIENSFTFENQHLTEILRKNDKNQ